MMMVKLTIKWEIDLNWAKMEFKKSRKLEKQTDNTKNKKPCQNCAKGKTINCQLK
jgi:hypothetical protein